MYNFWKIRTIRQWLMAELTETLVLTLVISHLDYCNSILLRVPDVTLKPFQRIQNMSAKLIFHMKYRDSALKL